MRLRHPAERASASTFSAFDEGEPHGYDNIALDAYAERWVDVDDAATPVLDWFVTKLTALGWTLEHPISTNGVAFVTLRRDEDEHVGILLQGVGEWWTHPDRDVRWHRENSPVHNRMRLHISIDPFGPTG